MKRFVCYTLEGLQSQAGLETWMPLGSYSSEAEAVAAGVVATGYASLRILPNYRVSGYEYRGRELHGAPAPRGIRRRGAATAPAQPAAVGA